jgi:DNA-binding HxlR family transcriptional regulator
MDVTASQLPPIGGPDCPVRDVLDHVGDKWTALVIANLADGTLRFSEIKRRVVGISQRMLTETVRGLERDGVLLRTVYPSVPPQVEYSLTPLGKSLVPLVMALVHWALEHRSEIKGARSTYDQEKMGRTPASAPQPQVRLASGLSSS